MKLWGSSRFRLSRYHLSPFDWNMCGAGFLCIIWPGVWAFLPTGKPVSRLPRRPDCVHIHHRSRRVNMG